MVVLSHVPDVVLTLFVVIVVDTVDAVDTVDVLIVVVLPVPLVIVELELVAKFKPVNAAETAFLSVSASASASASVSISALVLSSGFVVVFVSSVNSVVLVDCTVSFSFFSLVLLFSNFNFLILVDSVDSSNSIDFLFSSSGRVSIELEVPSSFVLSDNDISSLKLLQVFFLP